MEAIGMTPEPEMTQEALFDCRELVREHQPHIHKALMYYGLYTRFLDAFATVTILIFCITLIYAEVTNQWFETRITRSGTITFLFFFLICMALEYHRQGFKIAGKKPFFRTKIPGINPDQKQAIFESYLK
jgi:hypothetical protein